MKLNDKTDYSLRVIIYLLNHQGKATVREISDFYHVSYNHLRVIAHELTKLGVLNSSKGSSGGIELSEKAKSMPVSSVVRHFEGVGLVECFDPETNQCVLSPHCRLKSLLARSQKAFYQELEGVNLGDLH